MKLQAVIIHENLAMRDVLGQLLKAWTKHEIDVENAGYDIRLPGVWQRWLQQMDIFIVGLERRYERGLRAEGVAVAEKLAAAGTRVLIIGDDCSADQLSETAYWDLASPHSFLEAVDLCLEDAPLNVNRIERLRCHFGARLEIPTGH